MRLQRKLAARLACLLLVLLCGTSALAQQTQTPEKAPKAEGGTVTVERNTVLVSNPSTPTRAQQEVWTTTGATGTGGSTFTFVSSEMSFDLKVVKGAPYSAEAVTETVQLLADGNRIVRKNSAKIYRDNDGRTRREQMLTAIGPYATSGDTPQTIFINDPVTGFNYTLDTRNRSARKYSMPRYMATWHVPQGEVTRAVTTVYPAIAVAAGVQGNVKVVVDLNEAGEVTAARVIEGHPLLQSAALDAAKKLRFKPIVRDGVASKSQLDILFKFARVENPSVTVVSTGGSAGTAAAVATNRALAELQAMSAVTLPRSSQTAAGVQAQKPVTESLGKQNIEGVEAEGTRSTVTIPAGQIGNERPIQIINERWYSPELQTVVLTKRIDPLVGETTYRLTNINRAEPDRSLFEVPADYKIKETTGSNTLRMRTRKTEEEKEKEKGKQQQ
ncbi:MAG TPA: energy transducer TonB [Pyrinomonadaceae bacterium]